MSRMLNDRYRRLFGLPLLAGTHEALLLKVTLNRMRDRRCVRLSRLNLVVGVGEVRQLGRVGGARLLRGFLDRVSVGIVAACYTGSCVSKAESVGCLGGQSTNPRQRRQ